MRTGEESSGDVGESVGVQAALQGREYLRAEATGTSTDFENPQPATLGERTSRFLYSSGNSRKPMAFEQNGTIKLIEQPRSSASEQYLHGILPTAQNRTEFGAIS